MVQQRHEAQHAMFCGQLTAAGERRVLWYRGLGRCILRPALEIVATFVMYIEYHIIE